MKTPEEIRLSNNAKHMHWWRKNKERLALEDKIAHIFRDKRKIKEKWLIKKYGINMDTLDALAFFQENKCAICNLKKLIVVDHCHKTGKVRGLLCHACNRAFGMFREDPEILQRAVTYATLSCPTVKMEVA